MALVEERARSLIMREMQRIKVEMESISKRINSLDPSDSGDFAEIVLLEIAREHLARDYETLKSYFSGRDRTERILG